MNHVRKYQTTDAITDVVKHYGLLITLYNAQL